MFWSKRKSKRLNNPDANEHIGQCVELLTTNVQGRLSGLSRAVVTTPDDILKQVDDTFSYTLAATAAIKQLKHGLPPGSDVSPAVRPQLVVSSVFLREAFDYLTTDPERRERMLLVTATHTPDGSVVPSSMRQIKTTEQSAAYVKADQADFANYIEQLTERDQHQLLAMWHSHILVGEQSTRPSQTDIAHQDRLVQLGMTHVLGGIFSLDGWVRLFSTAVDFDLTLYGSAAEYVHDRPREKIIKLSVAGGRDVVPA
ncbi:MAG: hypothetical protein K0U74_11965 [Alphaproteobacteria bacterium]|nr:hypothetical protein [Alphaproteobacteria bacterium]